MKTLLISHFLFKATLFLTIVLVIFLFTACDNSEVPPSPHIAKLDLQDLQDPLELDFKDKIIIIRNSGGVNSLLRWEINFQNDWLIATPNSGRTTNNNVSYVRLSLKQGLAVGKYSTVATVSAVGVKSKSFTINAKVLSCSSSTSNLSRLKKQSLPSANGYYVANQLLINYQTTQSDARATVAKTLAQKYRFKILRSGSEYIPDIIEFNGDLESLAEILASDPLVSYVEFNYYLQTLGLTPNDPFYKEQWSLSNFGLPNAWEIETGAAKVAQDAVVIAVIDSGVDVKHVDLRAKMLPGCDFFDGDNDPRTLDSHGTHVAGIASAIGNNGTGVAGVAFGAGVKILPVKIFNDEGTEATIESLANAILWAAGLETSGFTKNPYPARILNISLGAAKVDVSASKVIEKAITAAYNAGALVFVAAGNDSADNLIRVPANAADAIAVGSVDSNFSRAYTSNYNNYGGKTVDIMAPGGRLITGNTTTCKRSSSPNTYYILNTFPNSTYGCLSGTSMATPFVAGVAALIWNQNSQLTAQEVKERLLESTYFNSSWNPKEYGKGVVCADKALGAKTTCGK